MNSVKKICRESKCLTLSDVREIAKDLENENNKIINCLLKSKVIKVTYDELKIKFDAGEEHIFILEKLLEMGMARDILEDIYHTADYVRNLTCVISQLNI